MNVYEYKLQGASPSVAKNSTSPITFVSPSLAFAHHTEPTEAAQEKSFAHRDLAMAANPAAWNENDVYIVPLGGTGTPRIYFSRKEWNSLGAAEARKELIIQCMVDEYTARTVKKFAEYPLQKQSMIRMTFRSWIEGVLHTATVGPYRDAFHAQANVAAPPVLSDLELPWDLLEAMRYLGELWFQPIFFFHNAGATSPEDALQLIRIFLQHWTRLAQSYRSRDTKGWKKHVSAVAESRTCTGSAELNKDCKKYFIFDLVGIGFLVHRLYENWFVRGLWAEKHAKRQYEREQQIRSAFSGHFGPVNPEESHTEDMQPNDGPNLSDLDDLLGRLVLDEDETVEA